MAELEGEEAGADYCMVCGRIVEHGGWRVEDNWGANLIGLICPQCSLKGVSKGESG